MENIEDLPRMPPGHRWQKLPKDMGNCNIGVIDEDGQRPMLTITFLHQELYQHVLIDSKVDSDVVDISTGAERVTVDGLLFSGLDAVVRILDSTLKSVFGPDYGPCGAEFSQPTNRCSWLQIRGLQ